VRTFVVEEDDSCMIVFLWKWWEWDVEAEGITLLTGIPSMTLPPIQKLQCRDAITTQKHILKALNKKLQ